jgi:hypothetical protein
VVVQVVGAESTQAHRAFRLPGAIHGPNEHSVTPPTKLVKLLSVRIL